MQINYKLNVLPLMWCGGSTFQQESGSVSFIMIEIKDMFL